MKKIVKRGIANGKSVSRKEERKEKNSVKKGKAKERKKSVKKGREKSNKKKKDEIINKTHEYLREASMLLATSTNSGEQSSNSCRRPSFAEILF